MPLGHDSFQKQSLDLSVQYRIPAAVLCFQNSVLLSVKLHFESGMQCAATTLGACLAQARQGNFLFPGF